MLCCEGFAKSAFVLMVNYMVTGRITFVKFDSDSQSPFSIFQRCNESKFVYWFSYFMGDTFMHTFVFQYDWNKWMSTFFSREGKCLLFSFVGLSVFVFANSHTMTNANICFSDATKCIGFSWVKSFLLKWTQQNEGVIEKWNGGRGVERWKRLKERRNGTERDGKESEGRAREWWMNA